MSDFFQPDNPIIRFLSRFFDLMVLNFLFIISCIPIVTIGAATSAMYFITIKMQSGNEPGIVKGYLKVFRQNFKQATLLWLPVLLGIVFLGADLYIIYRVLDPQFIFLQYPVFITLFILVSIMIYAFPLLSNYECNTKQLLKNSILISLSNIPTTIFIIVIHIIIIYVSSLSGKNLIIILSFALFFGFAALSYFFSIFIAKIFDRYI